MLHFLSVLLLFLLFAVVIAIAVGAYLLNKGIRMFRKAASPTPSTCSARGGWAGRTGS